jgi:hypothetical protein
MLPLISVARPEDVPPMDLGGVFSLLLVLAERAADALPWVIGVLDSVGVAGLPVALARPFARLAPVFLAPDPPFDFLAMTLGAFQGAAVGQTP